MAERGLSPMASAPKVLVPPSGCSTCLEREQGHDQPVPGSVLDRIPGMSSWYSWALTAIPRGDGMAGKGWVAASLPPREPSNHVHVAP